MVKERVKEERTYQDARGYLVCEEVWVEKEVERPLPMPTAPSIRPAPKPAPKPIVGKNGKKEPRGMVTEDAEEASGKEKKGKAKVVEKKVVTGAGSILGFFGKK